MLFNEDKSRKNMWWLLVRLIIGVKKEIDLPRDGRFIKIEIQRRD